MPDHYQKLEIQSSFSQAKQTEETIILETQKQGFNDESIFALRLSLEEALTNAIRHGNRCDPNKKVNIRYRVDSHKIDIFVLDEGIGFDPKQIPDPTTDENLSRPSGRGILLMRAYMNQVEYNDSGNEVHLVKLKNKSS